MLFLKTLAFPLFKAFLWDRRKDYLINFKKEGFSLHNIEYLIKDIEYYNKYKKFKVNSIKENKGFRINLIDYYKKNRAVPLIVFPNGRTFP